MSRRGFCYWEPDPEGSDTWKTACGHKHQTFAGSPSAANYNYCSYCGLPIVQRWRDETRDELYRVRIDWAIARDDRRALVNAIREALDCMVEPLRGCNCETCRGIRRTREILESALERVAETCPENSR